MTNSPLITVLMPVYNGEKYLREAVDSILGQSFADFELLAIDDGSSDSSSDVLASYSDPRVRVLKNERNLGLVKTLNRGLAEARGEYVARLDCDDIALPDRLAEQVRVLQANPNVLLVAGLSETIDPSGTVVGGQTGWKPSSEEIFYRLVFRNCIAHSTVMFRKAEIAGLGGYDESLIGVEDWDLWSRLSRVSRIMVLPKVLCRWRNLSSGLQQRFAAEQREFQKTQFAGNVMTASEGRVDAGQLACFLPFDSAEKVRMADALKSIPELRRLHEEIVRGAPLALDKDGLARYCECGFAEHVSRLVYLSSWAECLALIRHPALIWMCRSALGKKLFSRGR